MNGRLHSAACERTLKNDEAGSLRRIFFTGHEYLQAFIAHGATEIKKKYNFTR
jgi:hypothetical protein